MDIRNTLKVCWTLALESESTISSITSGIVTNLSDIDGVTVLSSRGEESLCVFTF